MITPSDMAKFSNNEVVIMYQKLNEQLSKTIIQKLKQNGDVSSFTRAQIRTLKLQGGKDIFLKALFKTNQLTAKRKREITKLFNEIADKEIKGYSEVYKLKDIDYKLSAESVQLLNKVKRITNNEMRNFTKSVAYASQNTYINAVDDLYKQVVSGSYDYDSAMKKTITDLAEKGVTLKTKDGRNERLEVAVRRNLMTSVKQTANSIAKDVGDVIGANCVVIGHSTRCRPSHHQIDSVIMSINKFKQLEYLTEEPNCYHIVNYDWRPEFENTKSKVVYDDEHLSYADTVKNYNIQQKARYYERQVRAKKSKIASGDNSDKAKQELRNAQTKLRIYNKANGLEQDHLRTWTVGYNEKKKIHNKASISNVKKDIKNKEYAKQLGENLYITNKFAKEYRDARWAEENFFYKNSLSEKKRNRINEITAKTLGFKNAEAMEKAPEIAKFEIVHQLKNKEQEIYDIKEKAIEKAIKQGAKIKGYHMFHNNGKWNRMEYIEIGNRGFHFEALGMGVPSSKLEYLGDIEGTISSEGDKKISLSDYDKALKEVKKYIKKRKTTK